MSGPRGPLSVRIHDGVEAKTVTRFVSGLKFSKVANGGHQACSMRLNLPTSFFSDLGPSDRLWVDDTRTGRNLFSAYTQNPTPVDGPGGQGFDLSALGGMIRASDETRGLIYVDRDLSGWVKDPLSVDAGDIDVGKWANNEAFDRIRTSMSGGSVIAPGAYVGAGNYTTEQTDMSVGAVRIGNWDSGSTNPGYAEELVTPTVTYTSRSMSVTGAGITAVVGDGVFPDNTRRIAVILRRIGGATNVVDNDVTWTDWTDISVIGQRMNRYGVLLRGIGALRSATDVRASEVVEDLIGRLLASAVDPSRATVVATTMPIGQLAFPERATAQRVIDELGDFEPDMQWGIGSDDGRPRSEGGRGHEFWYQPVTAAPRYEVTSADAYRQTGSETDLCNRVSVLWTNSVGVQQTTVVSATSDQYPALRALEDAGRVRDADPITLPDGKGSANNALTIGHLALAAKASPPRSATAVLTRYVRDLWTGADVHPCEVEPGCMVRVRSSGEDIYCTEMEYDDEAGATTLTLGDPVPTDAQRFAQLSVA